MIFVSVVEASVPEPFATRAVSCDVVVVLVPVVVWDCPVMPKDCAPPVPRVAVWVTVMSVPTPYSDLSTSFWATLTPEDAALTAIVKPIPSARPSAMTRAWRLRLYAAPRPR